MNFYKKRQMASRQGKAINHMYPSLFASGLKRKKHELPEPEPLYDFSKMLSDIEAKKLLEQEKAQQKMSETLNYSFKAISREQQEFSTRNKSGSPRVGLYNPKWEAVRPRTDQSPRYSTKATKSKEGYLFTPNCLQNNFNCSFPRRKSVEEVPDLGQYDKKLRRTLTKKKKYDKVAKKNEKNFKEIPKKGEKYIQSPIKFNMQLGRKEFVSPKDPPNEARFSFAGCYSKVHSSNRKVRSMDFGKWEERPELFPEKLSLVPYDRNEENCMPRLDISILEFGSRPSRQDLVHTQVLETPFPVELEVYENAFFKQSTVRGPTNIPSMSSTIPRDDLMYRVNDTYIYNVPDIQSAEAKAKYQGDLPVSLLKQKFKSNNN